MKQLMINLDYQSRVPIYLQIASCIEKYVTVGILKENMQIPSIREMASSLGINPNTVKKSYDILESKGVIKTISTKGTFVTSDIKNVTLDRINEKIGIIKEEINELEKMGVSFDEIIDMLDK